MMVEDKIKIRTAVCKLVVLSYNGAQETKLAHRKILLCKFSNTYKTEFNKIGLLKAYSRFYSVNLQALG